MSVLSLAVDHDGLPARVSEELEQMAAAIQAWANQSKSGITFPGAMTASQPRCRYVITTDQAIPASVDTDLVWSGTGHPYTTQTLFDGQQFDNGVSFGEAFLRTSSGSKLFLPMEGVYLAVLQVAWEDDNSGGREIALYSTIGAATTLRSKDTVSIVSNLGFSIYHQAFALIAVPSPTVAVAALRAVVKHTSTTDPLDVTDATIDIVKLS